MSNAGGGAVDNRGRSPSSRSQQQRPNAPSSGGNQSTVSRSRAGGDENRSTARSRDQGSERETEQLDGGGNKEDFEGGKQDAQEQDEAGEEVMTFYLIKNVYYQCQSQSKESVVTSVALHLSN